MTSDLALYATAVGTAFLAIATFIMASATHRSLGQQRDQMRHAVLPQLVPSGNLMRHQVPSRRVVALGPRASACDTSWVEPDIDEGDEFRIVNIGSGPALSLQWEVGPVPRDYTFAPPLLPGEVYAPWQSRGNQEQMPLPDGIQVTVWYKDVLGNEYHNLFKRQGVRWVYMPVTKPDRPPRWHWRWPWRRKKEPQMGL